MKILLVFAAACPACKPVASKSPPPDGLPTGQAAARMYFRSKIQSPIETFEDKFIKWTKLKKHKRLIIPIFVPQSGCPHQCVFCNQKKITSKTENTTPEEVKQTIHTYLETWKGEGIKEVAFYGGTFTSLDIGMQESLLSQAYNFVKQGLIDCLRVSTRPDSIDDERLNLLKKYGVTAVELGVQSMDDNVLEKSGRGHSSGDVRHAVKLLKENGFKIGLQIMPGLPCDTTETILYTAYEVTSLTPDFIRIYPTLIIKDTPLEKMFLNGLYEPWSLDDMVYICKKIMAIFERHNIPVIRVGLQPSEELSKNIVAGPFHPCFRQLLSKSNTNAINKMTLQNAL